MKNIFIKNVVFLVILSLSAPVLAAPITGQIAIGGNYKLSNTGLEADTVTSNNFPGYSHLHFYDAIVNLDSLDIAVTGDFDGLEGSLVTMNNPLQYEPNFSITQPLWAVGGFEFYMTSLSVDQIEVGALDLVGTGYVTKAGMDDTNGNWYFSAQTGLSWSSATIAVDEPGIILLLGLGLMGLLGIRRKNRPDNTL